MTASVTTNSFDQCNEMCLFIYFLTQNGSEFEKISESVWGWTKKVSCRFLFSFHQNYLTKIRRFKKGEKEALGMIMSYDQFIGVKLMSQHQLSSEKGLSSIRTNAEFKMMQSIM